MTEIEYTTDELHQLIREAAGLLVAATYPSVFTGAGVSKESGLPTYRGKDEGVWQNYDIDEVATPFAFHLNPKQVWDFWESQRQQMLAAQPNGGHIALAQIEQRYVPGLPIITQNVDDLHERAGSGQVTHLHGQMMQNRCSRYCQGVPSVVPDEVLVQNNETGVPRCPNCGELVRPDIILFGEYLHAAPMDTAKAVVAQTDVMLIAGTSGLVAPASKLPLIAQDNGATLVEINPSPSRITPNVDVYLPMGFKYALTQMLDFLDVALGS